MAYSWPVAWRKYLFPHSPNFQYSGSWYLTPLQQILWRFSSCSNFKKELSRRAWWHQANLLLSKDRTGFHAPDVNSRLRTMPSQYASKSCCNIHESLYFITSEIKNCMMKLSAIVKRTYIDVYVVIHLNVVVCIPRWHCCGEVWFGLCGKFKVPFYMVLHEWPQNISVLIIQINILSKLYCAYKGNYQPQEVTMFSILCVNCSIKYATRCCTVEYAKLQVLDFSNLKL